jgi:GxxExxY protein
MIEPSAGVDDFANRTIGAAIEVHTVLGAGFLESTYEQAMAIEFDVRGIPYQRQFEVSLNYKGRAVGSTRLDFLVGNLLIVELKAIEAFHPIHQAQVINYLKATNLHLGLLINFNTTKLKNGGIKRIVLT